MKLEKEKKTRACSTAKVNSRREDESDRQDEIDRRTNTEKKKRKGALQREIMTQKSVPINMTNVYNSPGEIV